MGQVVQSSIETGICSFRDYYNYASCTTYFSSAPPRRSPSARCKFTIGTCFFVFISFIFTYIIHTYTCTYQYLTFLRCGKSFTHLLGYYRDFGRDPIPMGMWGFQWRDLHTTLLKRQLRDIGRQTTH